jgi:hypothetical protein
MMEDTRDSYVRERRVFVNDATNSQCESCLYEVGLRPDPLEKLKISCVKKCQPHNHKARKHLFML